MLAAQFLDMYGRSNEGMRGRKMEERSEGPWLSCVVRLWVVTGGGWRCGSAAAE